MAVDDDLDSMFDDENTHATEETTEATTDTSEQAAESQEAPAAEQAAEADAGAADETAPAEEAEAPAAPSQATDEGDSEAAPAAPTPLTADDVRSIISDLRTQERDSGKTLDQAEKEILDAYYPQGLSNVLVDEKSGRELRTPQDVVDLSDGEMTIEEASQWLMNEQYKLDRQIVELKQSARELAETNTNFKQGVTRVLEKYQPIFDKYPQLQRKVYNNYMKTVKMDNEKDLVLSAPDIEDYYADVMEPYVMAFQYQQTPSTSAAEKPKIPESKQTAADRMDISGDSGSGAAETDPNDPDSELNKLFGE